MLVELTTSPVDLELNVFDVQGFFASTTSKKTNTIKTILNIDHEYECPFCYFKVQIIMDESLHIGDASQLDYSRTCDILAPTPSRTTAT
jgi:hypothetical protein